MADRFRPGVASRSWKLLSLLPCPRVLFCFCQRTCGVHCSTEGHLLPTADKIHCRRLTVEVSETVVASFLNLTCESTHTNKRRGSRNNTSGTQATTPLTRYLRSPTGFRSNFCTQRHRMPGSEIWGTTTPHLGELHERPPEAVAQKCTYRRKKRENASPQQAQSFAEESGNHYNPRVT